jgi:diguanylate cyclase (GGDEF)-like protein
MPAPPIPGQLRQRLTALIAEDRLEGERLLHRLRDLRALEGLPTCSSAVYLLAHVRLPEEEAEQLLEELVTHRRSISDSLGRDPGLRVSTIDYLSNVRPLLRNPTIIEHSSLEQTERSAITDDLTGLYNRRYFQSALELEVRRSRRYVLPMSLLMLDLDLFKSVNDVYGHPFGDIVLEQVGTVIRRAVRESDLACRIGGEEFAVIVPETDRLGAYAVAERVRHCIRSRFAEAPIGDRVVAMTVSGGVASYPEDGDESQALAARADQALYHSKTRGRDRVVIYHSERRETVRFPVRPDTLARVRMADGESVEGAGLVNLSAGGALLERMAPLPADTEIELTLTRTGVFGADGSHEIRGRVVRIDSGREGRPGRVAVRFESPLPESFLRDQVQWSPAPRAHDRGRS